MRIGFRFPVFVRPAPPKCDSPRSFYDRRTGRLECVGCPGDCPQAEPPDAPVEYRS